jgi:hypothetical protein
MQQNQFDGIIMGSRKKGQFSGMLFGSVSAEVAHKSRIPVELLCKNPWKFNKEKLNSPRADGSSVT